MTQGQAVSESIQWIIIRLSAVMPSHEISGFTDISDRKIHDILAHFKKTGGTKDSKREKPTLHGSRRGHSGIVYFCTAWLHSPVQAVLYSTFTTLLVIHRMCMTGYLDEL